MFHEHDNYSDRMMVSLDNGPDIAIVRVDVGRVVDAHHPITGKVIATLNVWDDDVKEEVEDEADEI